MAVSIGQSDIAPPLLDQADAVFRTDPERFAADRQQVVLSRAVLARRKGDYDTAIALLSDDLRPSSMCSPPTTAPCKRDYAGA